MADETEHKHGTQLASRPVAAAEDPPTGTIVWAWQYQPKMLVDTPRKVAGVHAFKAALIYNGYGRNIVLGTPAWGDATYQRTKDFQGAEGLQQDGIVGRTTARHLFHKLVAEVEYTYGIPDHLVGRMGSWESANDPVCRGVSGDEGWAQINMPSHPAVTLAQAWDPEWAIPWMARYLKGARLYTGDWGGAVAAYNVGYAQAKRWVDAGKLATGGPLLKDGTTLYQHCTLYVARVEAALY